MSKYLDKINNLKKKLNDKKLDKKTSNSICKYIIIFIISIMVVYILLNLSDSIIYKITILSLLGISNLIIYFMVFYKDIVTTIHGFIGHSIFINFGLFVILYMLALYFTKKFLFAYILILIVLTIVWTILSLLCDIDVAMISNTIITFVINILLNLNSFIWTVFEVEKKDISCINLTALDGLNKYETTKLMFDIILFSLIFIHSFGAIICAIKKYSNDKKSDNKKNSKKKRKNR